MLRQIFPPYQVTMTFQVGVCGATVGYPNSSPNPAGGASFGPNLTFAPCTDANANEYGAWHALAVRRVSMRACNTCGGHAATGVAAWA